MTGEISLEQIATLNLQIVELIGVLHALGQHFQVQGVRHRDDRIDDFHVIAVDRHVIDEALVDLQYVERE